MRVFAVIPAAGKSVRMGRPKLSLPIGDRTVLECVVAALTHAGVDEVLVILAPSPTRSVSEVRPTLNLDVRRVNEGATVLHLPEDTPDMRTTVEHGLDWLAENRHLTDDDAWLLVPADHPTLDASVVRRLIEARQANPRYSICVPTYEGKRGHPTLIAWRHRRGIRSLSADVGLNAYLRQHAQETMELPVTTPEILRDLDTPEDYERLRNKSHGGAEVK